MAVKELNGKELAGFIQERQIAQVRRLSIVPKLVILITSDSPVIASYVKMKKRYGADIGVEVDIRNVADSELLSEIHVANDDTEVHAIIVQLPLADEALTSDALSTVNPTKDVDGLGPNPQFDPATATAILWLLAGYNIELKGKKIAVIGQGRLVGAPLSKMLESGGHDVIKIDEHSENVPATVAECDVIVTATGVARLVKTEWVKPGAVVVDAGTAGEGGKIVGDVDDLVRERDDLGALTPLKGGVGPLTVCALFENTIQAAQQQSK